MPTRITVRKTIDPHLDARSAGAIFEPIDPISVDLCDLDAHDEL